MLAAAREGRAEPLQLVHGDRVVAEPAAVRIAQAIAERGGHEVEVVKRPPDLSRLLGGLRTLSLFGTGRTVVVVESSVVADRSGAADLIDEADEVAVPERGAELSNAERRAAGCVLQALRLFAVDARCGGAAQAIAALPDWALQGGKAFRSKRGNRPRGKRQVEDLADRLVAWLEAGREAGLEGYAEGDAAELAELAAGRFPEGHTLILAESSVALDHPVVRRLAERGALLELGRVEAARKGGWEGLETLLATLREETGVSIRANARDELARRTLQTGAGRDSAARAESTERFAAEYRKLATLVEGDAIDRASVEEGVEDRGDENLFAFLDDIGDGRGAKALERLDRLIAAADDPIAARLGLFARLADFARNLTAVAGMARAAGVPRGVTHYQTFKTRWAPKLKAARPYGAASPVAKVHDYPLHRAYLAASRMPSGTLERLPARILEAELALKGGSRQPETVLAELVAELATAGGSAVAS
ncbi:MAG: hypothetical protein R2991_09290 [Thermoanaerobaculia bacterium]